MTATQTDWTVDQETGRSNSSARFLEMESAINRIITSNTHGVLSHTTVIGLSRVIMSQLAHVYHLAPTAPPDKRLAFQTFGDHYLVVGESEKMPDDTWVHTCGTVLKSYTTYEPIWDMPELGPTVGGGEVRTVTRPYCPKCEVLL